MNAIGGGLAAIGNTPLVRLGKLVPEGAAEVWIKLEGGNPTGSYKDRMAVSVLKAAMERGDVAQAIQSSSLQVAALVRRLLSFPPFWG